MKKTAYCLTLLLIAGVGNWAAAAPLLHYTFDEASGDALDSGSAPQTSATLTGGATRSSDTPGGFGQSLDLRNDNPYAHALEGDAADLDGLGQLTLTTWLKVADYTSGNNRLSAKQAAGSFGGFSWNMNATTNDGPVGPDNFRLALFLGGDGGFGFAFSDADASAAEWAFLAATYDSTSGTIAYYMGDANTPVAPLGTPQAASTNPGTLDAGSALYGVGYTDAAPGADTSVNGLQDDVRVYGQVLTLAELEAVRLANVIPEPTALCLAVASMLGLATRRQRR